MADRPPYEKERRHLRVKVALDVKFTCVEAMERMIKADALDLSEGGMYIVTESTPQKGRTVMIEMPTINGGSVKFTGAVVHHRAIDGLPHGIGIQFDVLEAAAKKAVAEIVERAAAGKS